MWNERAKLVPSDPGDKAFISQDHLQRFCYRHYGIITDQVAMAVIDGFQVIYIGNNEFSGDVVGHSRVELLLEAPPVEKSC